MPRSIEQGFNDFHNKLKASVTENTAAKSHRASIESCIKGNLGLNRFVKIGSFGNGTNINGHSDVDYLASIPTSSLTQTSTASLDKVKTILENRFPKTGVKVSTPAVVCPFGSYKSEHTEIIVADYIRDEKGFKVYEIADGNGGWMEVSPDAHNYYVSEIDKKHAGKVKPLIRFIKAWKYFKEVPISSFYLEMRVAQYALKEPTIIYPIDVRNILITLSDNNLSAMQDPMGFAGLIKPCKTETLKQDAISKLKTAASRAENAVDAEVSQSTQSAFDWWHLLYDNQFPDYYL